MKKNELTDFTTEDLIAKQKTLKGILIVLSSLVFLYLLFFIYKLSTRTWEANNNLWTIMPGMLVVVISTTTVQYSKISKILQNRKEKK